MSALNLQKPFYKHHADKSEFLFTVYQKLNPQQSADFGQLY
jgi:hypothetical protein